MAKEYTRQDYENDKRFVSTYESLKPKQPTVREMFDALRVISRLKPMIHFRTRSLPGDGYLSMSIADALIENPEKGRTENVGSDCWIDNDLPHHQGAFELKGDDQRCRSIASRSKKWSRADALCSWHWASVCSAPGCFCFCRVRRRMMTCNCQNEVCIRTGNCGCSQKNDDCNNSVVGGAVGDAGLRRDGRVRALSDQGCH